MDKHVVGPQVSGTALCRGRPALSCWTWDGGTGELRSPAGERLASGAAGHTACSPENNTTATAAVPPRGLVKKHAWEINGQITFLWEQMRLSHARDWRRVMADPTWGCRAKGHPDSKATVCVSAASPGQSHHMLRDPHVPASPPPPARKRPPSPWGAGARGAGWAGPGTRQPVSQPALRATGPAPGEHAVSGGRGPGARLGFELSLTIPLKAFTLTNQAVSAWWEEGRACHPCGSGEGGRWSWNRAGAWQGAVLCYCPALHGPPTTRLLGADG